MIKSINGVVSEVNHQFTLGSIGFVYWVELDKLKPFICVSNFNKFGLREYWG